MKRIMIVGLAAVLAASTGCERVGEALVDAGLLGGLLGGVELPVELADPLFERLGARAAGGREGEESPEACAARECLEELGVVVTVLEPFHATIGRACRHHIVGGDLVDRLMMQ